MKSLFYPDTALTPEHCVLIKNVNFTEQRTVDVKGGSSKFNSGQLTDGPPVVGLFQVPMPMAPLKT